MFRFSFVPMMSGGMSGNFVSNRRTEQQCGKVTLKCKKGDRGLVLISFHAERRSHQQQAVLHSMGGLGSKLSAAVRAQRGKPYSTRVLGLFLNLKGKGQALPHTSPSRRQVCDWLALPSWCSGEMGSERGKLNYPGPGASRAAGVGRSAGSFQEKLPALLLLLPKRPPA